MGIIEAIKLITLEEGMEKGSQNTTYEIVKNIILNTNFEIPKIAALANCSESFVEKVQEDINRM